MEFEELKKRVEKDFKLEKPDFMTETATNLNIGAVDLSATQKLIFSISNFRGNNYLDIRTWFQDQSGEWKPTKKGIHLNFTKYEDFKQIINTVSDIISLAN